MPNTLKAGRASLALPRKSILLDLAERVIIASLFGQFAYRTLLRQADAPNLITALFFVSEFLPFVLILLRRPSATLSERPLDWIFGLTGSMAPLLVAQAKIDPVLPMSICIMTVITGIFIQASAKVVLGSSFGIVAANRGIKVLGPYRLIRHPMYAGYTLTHIGLLLAMPSFLNAALYSVALTLQIVRIHREERILTLDPAYREFMARVHYRLLPGVF
jgi:protein-S-isoprenylcysteine O-methyltransferase Ste14